MLKTVSSATNAIGALNFKGTWNAATNTPTIVSGVGVKGDYFVVGVAGSTTIDGISNWGVGDWIAYNGNIWQRVEGGADLNGVNLTVTNTTTLSGLTASTALALDASKNVVSVANTGTGDNVLATSPTLVTPVLGTPSSGIVTNLTGTASININGTVGATTPAAGSFTTLQFDSGFGSVGLAFGCRAWLNFDGTTNVGGNCDIRASGNVSTVADNGTGDYTVNFTTAMPDANYSATGMVRQDSTNGNRGAGGVQIKFGSTPTASALTLITAFGATADFDGALSDVPFVCIAIFR